jgi:predicted DNA-binding transcriptional regulator AlpA
MTNEPATTQKLVRRAEAAQALGISERTLDRWARGSEPVISPQPTRVAGVWYDAEEVAALKQELERTR